MNNFILLAKIVRAPELRYTQDNQTPVTEMLVEFQGLRPEDNYTLKVTGWNNLATEINEKYKVNDQVIIEGRLSMKTYDSPEGFKEKKAEVIASRLYRIEGSLSYAAEQPITSHASSDKVVSFDSYKAKTQESDQVYTQGVPLPPTNPVKSNEDSDFDNIPF